MIMASFISPLRNIIKRIKSRMIRLAGHVIRMGEVRNEVTQFWTENLISWKI
jgi:hypothetical protein